MSLDTGRPIDALDTMHLGSSDCLRVVAGTVMVFVVPHAGGRRIPVTQVTAGGTVAGADLADGDLIATALPGTRIELAAPSADRVAEMRVLAAGALAAARSYEAATADLIAVQEQHQQRVIDDALLGLAATVPGDRTTVSTGWDLSPEAMVIAFLGQQVGLHPDPLRLRRAATDAQVSGRDQITALAEAAGASIRRVELPAGWWRREGPPLMVWRGDTADAVTAAVWRRGRYHLWTPAAGLQGAVAATVAEDLGRQAAILEPLLDSRRPARLRDLVRLGVRGSRHSMLLVGGLTVVVGLLAAVIPVVTGALTQTVASQTRSTLLVVGCALVALALGDLLVRAVRSFALLRIRGRAVAITASAVWDRMLRLPMSWHNRGTVTSRMTDANAVDVASMSVPDTAITALLDVAAVGGALIGVFAVSPPLAFGLVGFLAVRALVEYGLIRRAARLTREVIDAAANSQSVVLQMVRGVNQLRVSGATGRAFARWATVQATATSKEVQRRRLSVLQQMAGALWPTLGLAVLFLITATAGASVGQLVTAQTALTVATSALAAGITAVGALLSARAVLQRADDVMTSTPESGTGQEIAELAGAVDLRDVVFGYRDDMPPVLNGVSLSIPAGSHVAIVGESGCGKSTLLRVLLGLEEPGSGIVSFDGRDLSGLDRASVRRQIGTVMQSSQLLPGTIRDNVDLGRGLSADEIRQALEMAQVADDVAAMPMGLSTAVVEGASTISGGQRQRILLARALAGRPRMVILDEATSALDNISQAAIVANLERLAVTRIVVAHRLSTIESADRIVVLDQGRIVEQGTFDDLMTAGGHFRELVERQQL